jgi:hypothetical protein
MELNDEQLVAMLRRYSGLPVRALVAKGVSVERMQKLIDAKKAFAWAGMYETWVIAESRQPETEGCQS